MVRTRNNPQDDAEASMQTKTQRGRTHLLLWQTNNKRLYIAHDDNASVTRHELQRMIRGFEEVLNWMVTMMEKMAPRLENNPLPQMRQEEP